MKILVVDDSVVMRSLLKQILKEVPGVDEVDVAANGSIALKKLNEFSYDLMILDLEMPELDGLATLESLKASHHSLRVVIFASETASSARKAIDAFRLGACEVLTKPVAETFDAEAVVNRLKNSIRPRIEVMIADHINQSSPAFAVNKGKGNTNAPWPQVNLRLFRPELLVIASSTGGPKALESIFSNLKGKCRVPIVITQHMPAFFTGMLAENLAKCSGLPASEASQGASLRAGTITVAPGGFHLKLAKKGGQVFTELNQDPPIHSVRPAADPLFFTAAQIYGSRVLGLVLTGMGHDGCDGAVAIKEAGGAILIQDRASSVVWGMPGSVWELGAYDDQGTLETLADYLQHMLFY